LVQLNFFTPYDLEKSLKTVNVDLSKLPTGIASGPLRSLKELPEHLYQR
jgi:hypothetical protein